MRAPPSRAGDVLVFLHADSLLTSAAGAALLREFPRSGRRWGRFDVTIEGASPLLGVVAAIDECPLATDRHRHR